MKNVAATSGQSVSFPKRDFEGGIASARYWVESEIVLNFGRFHLLLRLLSQPRFGASSRMQNTNIFAECKQNPHLKSNFLGLLLRWNSPCVAAQVVQCQKLGLVPSGHRKCGVNSGGMRPEIGEVTGITAISDAMDSDGEQMQRR